MYRKILFLLVTLSSCYHFVGSESSDTVTISVPYVKGDTTDGRLTNALARAVGCSSRFVFVSGNSERILKVRLIHDEKEKIGYRYDRDPISGDLEKNLVPTEGRRIIQAEVSLLDGISQETLLGPVIVSAFAEYDYVNSDNLYDLTFINSSGVRETVLNFSLGQLDSIEGAEDNALDPLYDQLAQKIINGLARQVE